MKIIVIICLLPLSLSLSQATIPQAPRPAATNDGTVSEVHAGKPIIEIITTSSTLKPTVDAKNASKTAETLTPSKDGNATNVSPDTANNTANKTVTDAPSTEKAPPSPAKPSTDKPATNDTTDAGNSGKPANTTLAPVTQKPTEPPKAVTEKPLQAARGFDGPSFIGGIILTLGLLAIGFMGFKYYKNQTERNYHTL